PSFQRVQKQYPGTIKVLNGSDGTALSTFAVPNESISGFSHVALGDIDGDGVVEIVAITEDSKIVAYDHTGGTPIWESEPFMPNNEGIWSTPSLADLDGDSSVEIMVGKTVLNGNDGSIKWVGEGDYIGNNMYQGSSQNLRYATSISYAADIISSSPGLEVIVGPSIYSSNGDLLWQNQDEGINDGYTAIADFDNDGDAEIVLVSNGYVSLLDHSGAVIWGPIQIMSTSQQADWGRGGPPVIADINGDGFVEIGIAGKNNYYVYDHLGIQLWKSRVNDSSSNMTGSSVFDFDGDGRVEIAYADQEYLRIYDGQTGEVRYEIPNRNGTWLEYPTIVDVNNDGQANILVSGSGTPFDENGSPDWQGVFAYESVDQTWIGTRSVWNQHAYHIDNINDDGTIPQIQKNSWQRHNSFRRNDFPDREGLAQADLSVSKLQLRLQDTAYDLQVNVHNRGLTDIPIGSVIQFFNGDPDSAGVLLGEIALGEMAKGDRRDVMLSGVDISGLTQDVYARVSYNGSVPECATKNNQTVSALVKVRVADEGGLFDTQTLLVSVDDTNEAPKIISNFLTRAKVAEEYRFKVEGVDQDKADSLRYTLVSGPDGMLINERSGQLRWLPFESQIGIQQVTIRVTDLNGAYAQQSFSVEVVAETVNQRPYFITVLPDDWMIGEELVQTVEAFDPEGTAITIEVSNAPSGLNFDEQTNTFTWTPGSPAQYLIEFIATDENGRFSTLSHYVTVNEDPENPFQQIISEPEQRSVLIGELYRYEWLVQDPEGDPITYSIEYGPQTMTIDAATGVVEWTPTESDEGLHHVRLRAEDNRGGYATQTYTLVAYKAGGQQSQLLIVSRPPAGAAINVPWQYQVVVRNLSDGELAYELIDGPSGMSMNPETGLVNWIPASTGLIDATIKVTDSYGATTTQWFEFKVLPEPLPFQFVGSPEHFAEVNHLYRYGPHLSEHGSGQLQYSLGEHPAGMTIDAATGLILWLPITSDIGHHVVEIFVDEPELGRASQVYTLTVEEESVIHFLTPPPTSGAVGKQYWYGLKVEKREVDEFQFSLIDPPEGMNIDENTGVINWLPAEVGDYAINIEVTDGEDIVNQEFTLTIYSDVIRGRNVCEME
ncbi:MAG: putative Ig domain-containing protein, partial [Pseudomonadales bacterium]|nr:putative Ig domain-containing protein [Pseudomonadales bacterium]